MNDAHGVLPMQQLQECPFNPGLPSVLPVLAPQQLLDNARSRIGRSRTRPQVVVSKATPFRRSAALDSPYSSPEKCSGVSSPRPDHALARQAVLLPLPPSPPRAPPSDTTPYSSLHDVGLRKHGLANVLPGVAKARPAGSFSKRAVTSRVVERPQDNDIYNQRIIRLTRACQSEVFNNDKVSMDVGTDNWDVARNNLGRIEVFHDKVSMNLDDLYWDVRRDTLAEAQLFSDSWDVSHSNLVDLTDASTCPSVIMIGANAETLVFGLDECDLDPFTGSMSSRTFSSLPPSGIRKGGRRTVHTANAPPRRHPHQPCMATFHDIDARRPNVNTQIHVRSPTAKAGVARHKSVTGLVMDMPTRQQSTYTEFGSPTDPHHGVIVAPVGELKDSPFSTNGSWL